MSFNPGTSGIGGASDVALSNPADAQALAYNATTAKWQNQTIIVPDENFTFSYQGTVAVSTGVSRQYVCANYTIDMVYAGVNTAPTGASLIVDIKKNGTSIYATAANRPTIAASGHYNLAGAASTTSLVAGDYLTVDVMQVGSTVAGSDLTVTLRLKKT